MCQQPWRHSQCQQERAEAGDAGALLQPGGEAGQRNPGCQCPHLPFAVCVALPCVCASASCTCITNSRLWKNQFGKELRGLSTLHFSSEREISPESVWIWCSGGFYLQTLPVLTLSPAGPSAEAAWAVRILHHWATRGPGSIPAVTWEHCMQFWKGSPVSAGLQEFHRFPHHTNLVIDGSHSKILHLNKRPELHKIKPSWSKLTSLQV